MSLVNDSSNKLAKYEMSDTSISLFLLEKVFGNNYCSQSLKTCVSQK